MSVVNALEVSIVLFVLAALGVATFALLRIQAVQKRDALWGDLMSKTPWVDAAFDPAALENLPEPARRFLTFAIPTGSALRTIAIVGTRTAKGKAHTIVAAPHGWARRWYDGRLSGITGFYKKKRLHGSWWGKIVPIDGRPMPEAALIERAALDAVLWTPTVFCSPGTKWTGLDENRVRLTLALNDQSCDLDLSVSSSGALEAILTRDGRIAAIPETFEQLSGLRLPTRVRMGQETVSVDSIRFVPPYRGHSHS